MLIRFLTWLGIIKGIWLECSEGKVYLSYVKVTPTGKLYAYVYPFVKVRRLFLHEDGSVITQTYVKHWGYLRHNYKLIKEG